jgi:hypothetical protein
MRKRRVVVTLELETRLKIGDLRDKELWLGVLLVGDEVEQVEVNVVKGERG